MNKKLYGTTRVRDLQFTIPSGEGAAFLDAFAPRSRMPGQTITNWGQRVSENGRVVGISFDYTARHATKGGSPRADLDSNIERWAKDAMEKIGEGEHKYRWDGTYLATFTEKPDPKEHAKKMIAATYGRGR